MGFLLSLFSMDNRGRSRNSQWEEIVDDILDTFSKNYLKKKVSNFKPHYILPYPNGMLAHAL